MESIIHQVSPLGAYLEGRGEAFPDLQTTEYDSEKSLNKPSFAPKGPPKPAQSQVQKLLSSLQTKGRRRSRTLTALQDICSTAISVRTIGNERFLDQFRYSIIASPLLVHEAKPAVDTIFSHPVMNDCFSLQAAAVTIAISFLSAWIFHSAKTRTSTSTMHWYNACIYLMLMLGVAIGICGYARRKTSQRIRHGAVRALSGLITQCNALDQIARLALGLIQEIEVVSRGYGISHPLPPISRVESKASDRRCLTLRSGIASAISSTIHHYLEAHSAMLPLVDPINMQRYHDIYDLSRQDYQEMIQGLPSTCEEDPQSLKGLKTTLMRLFIARQIFLCDLLALPSESPIPDFRRWSVISDEITNLSTVVGVAAAGIGHLITEEGNRNMGDQLRARSQETSQPDESSSSEMIPPTTPSTKRAQAQLRRLDELSQSIRSLNARMLLMRDDANGLIGDTKTSLDVNSVLSTQYDLLGADLRNLMSEWEHGRNTMLLGVGAVDRLSLSRSSSGLRSPHSPVHSLGGTTAVNEGSPAEALRRLTGEGLQGSSNDGQGSDEEVFEALSFSPKSKRSSMTREEKRAKMQEDRQKRATLQEGRAATTNMLRELETVIKHRPRGRTSSRITSV